MSRERSALTAELTKILGLVAPITMSADQQTLWLASAVEALAGFTAEEVAAVSIDVRQTVTRPSQIVPEIARLIPELRERRRIMALPKREIVEIPRPEPKPFTDDEIARMSKATRDMGLKCGALARTSGGRIVDAARQSSGSAE